MKELLIGAGNSKIKRITVENKDFSWKNLVTLDIDPNSNPDIIHDLRKLPYPLGTEEFDEIHAYDVLEHTGQQGDWEFFFNQFNEFHRILKPNGLFYIIYPKWDSVWAWGDPGHTRVLSVSTFTFLSQEQYRKQVGISAMTDYRFIYKGDFELVTGMEVSEHQEAVILRRI